MDINYKTILKYLYADNVEETDEKNNFPTKKNIMISSDNFPDFVSKHLVSNGKKTFYRYGISRYNQEQNNISFLTSFLTLLNKQFITLDKKEELRELSIFMKEIRTKLLEKGFKFELKYKFEHQILIDRIEKLDFEDGLIIQLISQILDINFLILDFKEENIFTIFKGDFYNPWKVTLLLAKNNKDWEPLFCDKKQFSFNDSFLKKVLTNEEIKYYNEEYLNKSYSLLDNVKEISKMNNLLTEEEESSSSENNNSETFINPQNEIKEMKLTKTKLRSLKKDQVYQLINNLNLDISKDVNKATMIESLLPYI